MVYFPTVLTWLLCMKHIWNEFTITEIIQKMKKKLSMGQKSDDLNYPKPSSLSRPSMLALLPLSAVIPAAKICANPRPASTRSALTPDPASSPHGQAAG